MQLKIACSHRLAAEFEFFRSKAKKEVGLQNSVLCFQIVQESPFLTMDLLESCFPYALLRNSYHHVYKYGEA